jgi:hypothetical protein
MEPLLHIWSTLSPNPPVAAEACATSGSSEACCTPCCSPGKRTQCVKRREHMESQKTVDVHKHSRLLTRTFTPFLLHVLQVPWLSKWIHRVAWKQSRPEHTCRHIKAGRNAFHLTLPARAFRAAFTHGKALGSCMTLGKLWIQCVRSWNQ